MTEEKKRIRENDSDNSWHLWGPYLTERQWGTVREDYSPDGKAWEYTTHNMAPSKAYRWGEEGIGGICDNKQRLCFAVGFWNGKDKMIKERLFGLTHEEGNHGEDVKECYYYLDNTPSHSYMKMLYKYPQNEFPYSKLLEENKKRNRKEPEYELTDTGIFDENKYFDVFIEYAKYSQTDILIKITAVNRGNESEELKVIPQLWFRNTWSWTLDSYKPCIKSAGINLITAEHIILGNYYLYFDEEPFPVYCDNDTNVPKLFKTQTVNGYYKDGINEFLVNNKKDSVNHNNRGTKTGLIYSLKVEGNKSVTVRLRLSGEQLENSFSKFDDILQKRKDEADEFYGELQKNIKNDDARTIQRQAYAGLLWTKQFYYYDIPQWLNGDTAQPPPPKERLNGRNSEWFHLNNSDIVSMPDKWEYPWYAAWDLAFHCIALAKIDSSFAKKQLTLLTHEWYMHPNGQFPAYEWNFSDVNPPVHAWAALKVYDIDKAQNRDKGDLQFLENIFLKLLINFTWWVNREDADNHNIFQGGFLGLDNITIFDRSSGVPAGEQLEQADGTSWMAMYSLNMMRISLELAKSNPVFQSTATKFLEHFLYIAGAMTNIGSRGIDLWDDEDEFFFDVLHTPDDKQIKLKVRSLVGLLPLLAVEVIEPEIISLCPDFSRRMDWFLNYRSDLSSLVSKWHVEGKGERRLFSLLRGHRMKCLLKRMLDETEFLSDCGVRSLSKYHKEHPYIYKADGKEFSVDYEPGESQTGLFGGNSNWRGPVWFPVNYLLIESLEKFYNYYGDDFRVECPTNSGNYLNLQEIADELSRRLSNIFLKDSLNKRRVFGNNPKFQLDPFFCENILFYEYFNGDNGSGIGASHQTGWTGLIIDVIERDYKFY